MTPQIDTVRRTQQSSKAQLEIMVEPVEEQELVDALSALVLLGKVDFYQAKDCTERSDWERARRLIEEAEG